MQKCTLALGCFWKPEENFKSKQGIIQTEVGYAGAKVTKLPTKRFALVQVMLKGEADFR